MSDWKPRNDPSLSVLPAEDTPKPGFKVYEVEGTECYRVPEGTPLPTSLQEAGDLMVDENLITEEDDLREGDRLVVQDLIGLNLACVEKHDGTMVAYSENRAMLYMLKFVNDRPDPEPARWVCIGSANIRAIQRLNLTP